jgi:hypothetical protein
VPQATFSQNGSKCPVTAIRKEAPAAGQVYDANHLPFDAQQMLTLDRAGSNYPIMNNEVGLNQPCWDEDGFYMKYRSDIDYSFSYNIDSCSTSFKGSQGDVTYMNSGLQINEFDLLESNGIMREMVHWRNDFLSQRIYGGYNVEAHRRYAYSLWDKPYDQWDFSCTQRGMGPEEFVEITESTGTLTSMLLVLTITTGLTCCVNLCAGILQLNTKHHHDVKGTPLLIKYLIAVLFCLATNISAWVAWTDMAAVNLDKIDDALKMECAGSASFLHYNMGMINEFASSAGGKFMLILALSSVQIGMYVVSFLALYFLKGSSH